MAFEVVGLHFFADSSEAHPVRGVYDPQFLRDYAVAHEEAGFDRVLVGQTATWPDPLSTAAHIAAVTKTLKFMVAHRPGFIAPTMAARMFATLDRASGGRAGVHIITGASDVETQADGDYLTKEQRYHRSREYVEILRRMWSSEVPFDHAGEWYRFNGAFALVKPVQEQIPVFWAGNSDAAVQMGAQVCDVYAIGPATLADTRATIARFKQEAALHGRNPDVSMSMRVIVADTEDAAWEKAERLLGTVMDHLASGRQIGRDKGDNDPGTLALKRQAAMGDRLDERLWTGMTRATEGRLHATALVGTPDQVAAALEQYHAIGVNRFLLNGFYTIEDVRLFGEGLVPVLRKRIGAAG
ncbi:MULTISPECIES: LLM class flavin-dependent oxidoreductase [Novosphingobium]|jgi:alkanesulfonate monooxygenase|uniref:LLM class flavin-dependent oxidoreductase n=1 Tax=Novosphingobium TaxID=165696 RepID=UPI0022F24ACE|nr:MULTISPECIES: LLM class flavin-dependent oxidoreductase [Novosphingobium]GLK46091.1 alkanesulfonate monooxygenase [Novosphingobium resinovorum]